MSCQCYQIGGPFIAEDPDCPIHGANSVVTGYEDYILTLRSALEFYANAAAWQRDGVCDPNSGRFVGPRIAEEALQVQQPGY